MTREQKMQAVVEAARVVLRERLGVDAAAWEVACARLDAALATLDAHTEAQETVTLAAWRNPRGAVLFSVAGTDDDHCTTDEWTRLGTFTLPLDREGGR